MCARWINLRASWVTPQSGFNSSLPLPLHAHQNTSAPIPGLMQGVAAWLEETDYAAYPAVQRFSSLADLLAQLLVLDPRPVASRMAAFNAAGQEQTTALLARTLAALLS